MLRHTTSGDSPVQDAAPINNPSPATSPLSPDPAVSPIIRAEQIQKYYSQPSQNRIQVSTSIAGKVYLFEGSL